MLDGKIIKQIKNMENNYLVTIEQHNQLISELAIQLEQTISSLKIMDADITKLEELFNDLEAEYIQLQTDFVNARTENYIKALQIEKLRDENTHLKNQIK
jgi:inactivated superfamily I helicase